MPSAICFNLDQSKILLSGNGLTVYYMTKFFNLTLSQTSPGFTCLQYKSFENTVGKEEIARNEQFLLFPQCFLPVW